MITCTHIRIPHGITLSLTFTKLPHLYMYRDQRMDFYFYWHLHWHPHAYQQKHAHLHKHYALRSSYHLSPCPYQKGTHKSSSTQISQKTTPVLSGALEEIRQLPAMISRSAVFTLVVQCQPHSEHTTSRVEPLPFTTCTYSLSEKIRSVWYHI